MTTLISLPLEIQHSIITLQTHISLIALSQTNRHFRSLINPDHSRFVRRLLALELQEEYCGPAFTFTGRDIDLRQPWDEAKTWKDIKYACCGCMKLLSHMSFDNNSILRLRFRKPPPGAPAASQITEWEPSSDMKSKWHLRNKRLAKDKANVEKYRRHCHGIPLISRRYGIGRSEEHDHYDAVVLATQLLICGRSRDRRLCNECRFLRNRSRDAKSAYSNNLGTATVVAANSRALYFPTSLDRYFPDLCPCTGPTHHLRKTYSNDPIARESWALRMVRCPACRVWQELAAFREGSHLHPREPIVWSKLSHVNCNRCVFKEQGTAVLQKCLLQLWNRHSTIQIKSAGWRFMSGWRRLEIFLVSYAREEHKKQIKGELLDGIPRQKNGYDRGYHMDLNPENADHDDLRRKLGKWRDFFTAHAHEYNTSLGKLHLGLQGWMDGYEINEKAWLLLKERKAKMNSEPQLLVDYALADENPYGARGGYANQRDHVQSEICT